MAELLLPSRDFTNTLNKFVFLIPLSHRRLDSVNGSKKNKLLLLVVRKPFTPLNKCRVVAGADPTITRDSCEV